MTTKTINIAKEFSEVPSGRFLEDGPYSGELFRDTLLVPVLKEFDSVTVELDGVEGYGSSFLEEAFGGLIRLCIFNKQEIGEKLVIKADTPRFESYRRKVLQHIAKAKPEK
jgi:hypothetical protein